MSSRVSLSSRRLAITAWIAAIPFLPPLVAAQESPAAAGYARSSRGTRWLEAPGVAIKVLVEASNFGSGEVEVAELRLDPGSTGGEHRHGSHELIYVLEGTLDHVVNGETYRLEPGMVGIVKQGDTVAHRVVGSTPVRAVLVWAPGGEAERLSTVLEARPIDSPVGAATSP